jgi:prepilin-type N-terminal cleavage/methylation domain-containing protein
MNAPREVRELCVVHECLPFSGVDSNMKRMSEKTGFTLVELLVVITIIAILIALLLPAVQTAREAARRMHCSNNMKQLALGALDHESANKFFPTGGWGPCWAGDSDRGFGGRQPGGWIYSILPYIDQQTLYELGHGATASSSPSLFDCVLKCVGTPLTGFYCPSRRPPVVYPHLSPGGQKYHTRCGDLDWPALAGKTDYAANSGTTNDGGFDHGPADYADADSWTPRDWGHQVAPLKPISHVTDTGAIFTHSSVSMADISDGSSNTYLLGEKYLNADCYIDCNEGFDDQSWDIGDDWDINRFTGVTGDFANTGYLPFQDAPGSDAAGGSFGSAHAAGFGMAFCDGSVQFISYSIDVKTHYCLGNRSDSVQVDAKKL